MVELLSARGCTVVAAVGTPDGLLAAVAEHGPDVAVVDIRMPPSHTERGHPCAALWNCGRPLLQVGILVLLPARGGLLGGCGCCPAAPPESGYLLKERVARTSELVDALHRVATVVRLDPEIVTGLLEGGARRNRIERSPGGNARCSASWRRGIPTGRSPSAWS